jgi:hypothetical protein
MRRRTLITLSAATGAVGLGPKRAHAATELPTQRRLGVYKGAGCAGRAALLGFSTWLGRKPDWAVDFVAQETWLTFDGSASWIAGCWRGADYHLSLAVPMLTQDHHNTLVQGVAGVYDGHFKRLAQALVSTGHPDSVIRLGWEFNGNWYTWNAAQNPDLFIRYWRRIVGVMRAVPNNRFRFDWNPTLGRAGIPADEAYPGDDVVDIIGLDVYNQSWTKPRPSSQERWIELRQQPFGLDWHKSFAAAKGKPRSFPEWGTGRRPDGSGGEDDPLFISEMAQWIAATDVVYHGYWDYPDPGYYGLMSTGRFPRAAAMFHDRFGNTTPTP